ncbi:MAG: DUF6458 family protein [Thermoleophilia bacterium]
MGFGLGILLIAAGAILAWAVNAPSRSVDVEMIGYILLAVGGVCVLLSLVLWSTWAGPGGVVRRRAVRRPAARTTVVVDEYHSRASGRASGRAGRPDACRDVTTSARCTRRALSRSRARSPTRGRGSGRSPSRATAPTLRARARSPRSRRPS